MSPVTEHQWIMDPFRKHYLLPTSDDCKQSVTGDYKICSKYEIT